MSQYLTLAILVALLVKNDFQSRRVAVVGLNKELYLLRSIMTGSYPIFFVKTCGLHYAHDFFEEFVQCASLNLASLQSYS